MFNKEEFKHEATEFVEWITDYFADVENFPVRSQVRYGEIRKQLKATPPEQGESITTIFNDFKEKLLPGITHWQSPKYFAYFPANSRQNQGIGLARKRRDHPEHAPTLCSRSG